MQDTNETVEGPVPSHHLLIAGTGRAGTSFLVRYLCAEIALGGRIHRRNPGEQSVFFRCHHHSDARPGRGGFEQKHPWVHSAAKADIPLIFPVFPRMVEDWSYLYETLKPILPATITAEAAKSAHDQVASMSLVRVGSELSGAEPNQAAETAGQPIHHYPTTSDIDLIALRRELTRVRQERQAAAEDVARLFSDIARLSTQCNTMEAEVKRLEMELETAQKYEEENAIILGRLGSLLNSKSWRLTAPLRKLVDTARPKRRI